MDTDGHKYDGPHAALTFAIVGCAMEVLNEPGHGLREKACENSLMVELGLKSLRVAQQRHVDVTYKGVLVDDFVPDLIVSDAVVVDTKVIDRIGDLERGQMLNHLRVTNLKVGLILNFKWPRLEWERLAL